MFRRFIRDRRANIAMMFGIVTVPLIVATGGAIDFSRAYEQRIVVQDALDAAALAANRLLGFATEEEIYAEALAFFNANILGRLDAETVLNMVIDGGTVALSTTLGVPTTFLGIIDIDQINFNVRSLSMSGAATYEIVMVLDNSTSMRGSKIDSLKVAATNLVNSVFALAVSNPAPDPIRVGIVPFAASVNVGPSYDTAAWMDTTGIGPNAGINHDYDATPTTPFTNRFSLFNAMTNVDWLGCVEARAHPYDTIDTTPTAAVPATLFEPMFAPDEPDATGFPNNYLSDTGGTCQTATGQLDYCTNDTCRQERVCKYNNVSGTYFNGPGEGPNLHCTATALTPLTNNQNTLLNAIDAMYAPQSPAGYTNIEEGVMWGWRLLSDNAPFTEGRPYGEGGNHKVLIVMTDGANTYISRSNMNRSQYMAFNYIVHGYLGTTSTTNSIVVDAMNARTIEACDNVHNTGYITVYTVAFQVDDADAQAILEGCASDPTKAFDASNNDELVAVFQLIAQDVAKLRIAE
jgi:Flp pilus assembly protein TadG